MSVRKIAGIVKLSPATVSLALQNSPKITAATRERVLAAAHEIGYKPDTKVAELMSRPCVPLRKRTGIKHESFAAYFTVNIIYSVRVLFNYTVKIS